MATKDDVNESPFDEACRFIIEVGKAARHYGSTTTQIESYLSQLVVALGYLQSDQHGDLFRLLGNGEFLAANTC